MSAALIIEGLRVSLADRERRFSLSVPELRLAAGEVAGLSGPSGTGKTMLLEVLGLLRRPEAGTVYRLEAESAAVDLAGLWSGSGPGAPEVRAAHFGFVPQSGGLLPFLTVAENIALSQRIAGRPDPAWQRDLEKRLGLDAVRGLPPSAPSGSSCAASISSPDRCQT